ncbi:uncharacterized protein V2V93DRAFT_361923 [Kockiozyma suomiensis]|uniref:uncharacterized protein n=1 Tax=Kockiozyma suomiensis TaxID=1337062 RepID=UPI003343619C
MPDAVASRDAITTCSQQQPVTISEMETTGIRSSMIAILSHPALTGQSGFDERRTYQPRFMEPRGVSEDTWMAFVKEVNLFLVDCNSEDVSDEESFSDEERLSDDGSFSDDDGEENEEFEEGKIGNTTGDIHDPESDTEDMEYVMENRLSSGRTSPGSEDVISHAHAIPFFIANFPYCKLRMQSAPQLLPYLFVDRCSKMIFQNTRIKVHLLPFNEARQLGAVFVVQPDEVDRSGQIRSRMEEWLCGVRGCKMSYECPQRLEERCVIGRLRRMLRNVKEEDKVPIPSGWKRYDYESNTCKLYENQNVLVVEGF